MGAVEEMIPKDKLIKSRATSCGFPHCPLSILLPLPSFKTLLPNPTSDMATTTSKPTQDWASLIQQKLAQRESHIPKEWRLPETIMSRVDRDGLVSGFDLFNETTVLTKKERGITEDFDATGLLEKLVSGSLTSLEVTTAFCKRAAVAHQLVSGVVQACAILIRSRLTEISSTLSRKSSLIEPWSEQENATPFWPATASQWVASMASPSASRTCSC